MRFGRANCVRRAGAGALLLLLALTGGCGGGKGEVSGEVTVDGKPLTLGAIVFTPASGPAVAAEVVDGKYRATGVPTGDCKVSLDLSTLKQLVAQNAPKTGAAAFGAKFGKGQDAAKEKSMNPSAGAMKEMPGEAKQQLQEQQKATAEGQRRAKDGAGQLTAVDAKYTDPNTSGWTIKVSVGANTFDAKVGK